MNAPEIAKQRATDLKGRERVIDFILLTPCGFAVSAMVISAFYTSAALVGGCFVVAIILFVVSVFMKLMIGDLYLNQEVWFKCTECGKNISGHSPWRCGYCDFENPQPKSVCHGSILSFCGKCPAAILSVQCPHCLRNLSLVEGGDNEHAAVILGITPTLSAIAANMPKELKTPEQIKLEAELHAQIVDNIERETQLIQAQNRRVLAKRQLEDAAREKSGESDGAALDEFIKELKTADARESAIQAFLKEREQTYRAEQSSGGEDAEDRIEALKEMAAVIRSKYM